MTLDERADPFLHPWSARTMTYLLLLQDVIVCAFEREHVKVPCRCICEDGGGQSVPLQWSVSLFCVWLILFLAFFVVFTSSSLLALLQIHYLLNEWLFHEFFFLLLLFYIHY